MNESLYHGSSVGDIAALEPRSLLHGTDRRVCYLTDSLAYAMVYIWDAARHQTARKWVTCGFREGVPFYEEQFPDQLRTFYRGVRGFVYEVERSSDFEQVENRPGLFYSDHPVKPVRVRTVPDVYEALLAEEQAGRLLVLRFREVSAARQAELTSMLAEYIRKNDFFATDAEQAAFMRRCFTDAWTLAEGA